MPSPADRRTALVALVMGSIICAQVAWMVTSQRNMEARLDAMARRPPLVAAAPTAEPSAAGAVKGRRGPDARHEASAGAAPIAAAVSPQSQAFIDDLHLLPKHWAGIVRANQNWLTFLRKAKADGGDQSTAAIHAAEVHFLELNAVLQPLPQGLEKYRKFEASLPGERVVLETPDKHRYEGVDFE
jgi:hypothetical protein